MLANGVKETTTTTGTGTVTLSAVTGFPRFSSVLSVGQFVDYAIQDGNNWEWGVGKIGASNTLERTLVTATYSSGTYSKNPATPLSLSGSATVMCTITAETGGIGRGGGSLNRTPQTVLSGHMVKNAAGSSTTGYTLTGANRLHWFPFVWPSGIDRFATGVRLNVFTAAGTKMRIAIVEPGNPMSASRIVAQTGDIATATTGIKTASFADPVALPLARYYLGVLCDGAPVLLAAQAGLMDPYILQDSGNFWPRGGSSTNVTAGWTDITDAMVQTAVTNGEDRALNDPMIAMVQA